MLQGKTSLDALASVPAPTIVTGAFDPDLLSVEEACDRDYSANW